MRHLNRKNICTPTKDDISIKNVKKHYGFELTPCDSKMTPNDSKMDFENDSKMTPNDSKKNQIDSKMTPNDSKIPKSIKSLKYICDFCNKCYSKNSNMRKHEKTCKVKKESETLIINQEEEIKQMKLEIEELKTKTIITNNTHNCNNTNNIHIHINNYGEEDTKYITKQYILNLLQKPYTAIPKLIKHIHFNEEHPENQNIKITNKKEPYVKILKGNKWELHNKKDTISELIDKQHSALTEIKIQKKMDKYLDEDDKDRLGQFNEQYEKDDKDLMNKLYKESEIMIINYS